MPTPASRSSPTASCSRSKSENSQPPRRARRVAARAIAERRPAPPGCIEAQIDEVRAAPFLAVERRQVGEPAVESERLRSPGVLDELLVHFSIALAHHPDRLVEGQVRRVDPGYEAIARRV